MIHFSEIEFTLSMTMVILFHLEWPSCFSESDYIITVRLANEIGHTLSIGQNVKAARDAISHGFS